MPANPPADHAGAMPPLDLATAVHIAAAGLAGLATWEALARLAAPLLFGVAPQPTDLIELALGIAGTAGVLVHLATGLAAFPAGYVLAVRPLAARLAPGLSRIALGAAYGVGLWVFALFGMATLLAGLPPFLDFDPIAWASLLGHVGLGVAIALVSARFEDRLRPLPPR